MKNPFKNTVFEFGVLNYKSMPDEDCAEVLLSGRSNAGKSSALNALAENRKLARTSKTPGRTTEINFFRVNEDLRLLDLPGYGFAKSNRSKKKDWGPMLGEYFQKRHSLKAVVVFMDIRHPLKEIDIDMIGLCRDFDVEFLPVLTKSDKVSNNQIFKLKQEVQKKTGVREVLTISTLRDQGIKELRTRLINYSLIDG
ncbi:MAG: ribosome biogenesis GTP-binding protein YihA/YsxC [Gammaproteobacteria bacterium]